MHCFKLCVCCYLCSSGVKGLFLPGDAVLYDFLSDQAEPLLNLLQLSPHLLRQRRRVLSLEDEQRDVFIWPQWECYFSHTVQSFMYVECLNVCLGITEHTQNVITGINLLGSCGSSLLNNVLPCACSCPKLAFEVPTLSQQCQWCPAGGAPFLQASLPPAAGHRPDKWAQSPKNIIVN